MNRKRKREETSPISITPTKIARYNKSFIEAKSNKSEENQKKKYIRHECSYI